MESVYVSKGAGLERVGSVEPVSVSSEPVYEPMAWCGRCECYRPRALDQGVPKVRRMASGFVGAFLVCGHVVAVRARRSGRAS